MTDSINPDHYKDGPTHTPCGDPIECADIAQEMDFCLGNVLKYIWRAGKKDPKKHIEDLEKAKWYLNREIMRLKKEETDV